MVTYGNHIQPSIYCNRLIFQGPQIRDRSIVTPKMIGSTRISPNPDGHFSSKKPWKIATFRTSLEGVLVTLRESQVVPNVLILYINI
jgi:hypothetical protein